jgi:transcriptional adapter 3
MPPSNVSSKGKAKPGSKPSATPRSRNTTPLPNVRSSAEPSSSLSYFNKPLGSYLKKCDTTVEEILDSGGSNTSIPSGNKLVAMREKIENVVLKNIETRCTHSESVLRELQNLRKNRAPREREKDKDPEDRERKHKLKKVAKKHDEDGKHPPTTGAHGVTRQDGVDPHKGKFWESNYLNPTSPWEARHILLWLSAACENSWTLLPLPTQQQNFVIQLDDRSFTDLRCRQLLCHVLAYIASPAVRCRCWGRALAQRL